MVRILYLYIILESLQFEYEFVTLPFIFKGNVGVGLAVLIVFITIIVALMASLAAIGVCERLRDVHGGGVYFIVSHVLGGKIGGTVGVMYAFGMVSVCWCNCVLEQQSLNLSV